MTNPKLNGAFCGHCHNLLFVDSDTGREYVIAPTPDDEGEAIPHEELCEMARLDCEPDIIVGKNDVRWLGVELIKEKYDGRINR